MVEVVLTGATVVELTLTGVEVVTAPFELVVTFCATAEVEGTRADVACTRVVVGVTALAVDVRTGATAVVEVDIVLASPAVGAPARALSFGRRELLSDMMRNILESQAGSTESSAESKGTRKEQKGR